MISVYLCPACAAIFSFLSSILHIMATAARRVPTPLPGRLQLLVFGENRIFALPSHATVGRSRFALKKAGGTGGLLSKRRSNNRNFRNFLFTITLQGYPSAIKALSGARGNMRAAGCT